MQRIQYVQRRLDDWGEAKQREKDGGARRMAISSIYTGRERVQCAADVPTWFTSDAEVAEIDALMLRLNEIDASAYEALRQVHFVGRPFSMTRNARKLGISRNALHERCCRGDFLIDRWLREKNTRSISAINTVRA